MAPMTVEQLRRHIEPLTVRLGRYMVFALVDGTFLWEDDMIGEGDMVRALWTDDLFPIGEDDLPPQPPARDGHRLLRPRQESTTTPRSLTGSRALLAAATLLSFSEAAEMPVAIIERDYHDYVVPEQQGFNIILIGMMVMAALGAIFGYCLNSLVAKLKRKEFADHCAKSLDAVGKVDCHDELIKRTSSRTVATQSMVVYARWRRQPRFILTPKDGDGVWSMDQRLDHKDPKRD